MTRFLRWSLAASAAFALAAAGAARATQADPAADGQAWSPAPFLFEAAEPHWLDAGVNLPGAPATAAPAASAPAEAADWKTNPSRFLPSPIYGRGLAGSE